MSPSAANSMQELPFFGQTDHDIERTSEVQRLKLDIKWTQMVF